MSKTLEVFEEDFSFLDFEVNAIRVGGGCISYYFNYLQMTEAFL